MVNTIEMLDTIDAKVSALVADVEGAAEGKSVGRIKRQIRALKIIRQLIDQYVDASEFELANGMENELFQMLECKKGRRIVFDIKEGDNIIQKMDEYQDVKDVYKRMLAQADAMGLKVVGSEFVRK